MQVSFELANSLLDKLDEIKEPVLIIFTGEEPASCLASDSGLTLATYALPLPWLQPAIAGIKAKSENWSEIPVTLSGEAGHFRIKSGEDCHIQGSVASSGVADMILDNVNFAQGQKIRVESLTLTFGNR